MKNRMMCGLVFVVAGAAAAWAADKIQPMNVRLGLWEVTITTANGGQMPVPAGFLARLTPEQRARLEARMKAQSGSDSKRTYKTCLTKEKLESDNFGLDKQNCSQTIITSTSSKLAGKATCVEQGIKFDGTLELAATNTENVRGTMHMTATSNNHTMNVDSTYAAKWVGASCGNVK